ncbi:hypothetical protein BJY52DRAFT_297717 [Lactarius psammicola]|nr:hypothetical protein BJY52DRAFT_297717 [Lactarius psammicola]
MHDSYIEIVPPFRSDHQLLEQYTNPCGGLRAWKLLEYLDTLASSIAYRHVLGPSIKNWAPLPSMGFTASVDHEECDLRRKQFNRGRCEEGEAWGQLARWALMLGRFLMVCGNEFTHSAYSVNALSVYTPEESALNAIGEAHLGHGLSRAQQVSLTRPTFVHPGESVVGFLPEVCYGAP